MDASPEGADAMNADEFETRRQIADDLISATDDPQAAIRAIGEALEGLADLTERNEPYASRSIAEMRAAAARVYDLIHLLDEAPK
jgi:hypothetical protein